MGARLAGDKKKPAFAGFFDRGTIARKARSYGEIAFAISARIAAIVAA